MTERIAANRSGGPLGAEATGDLAVGGSRTQLALTGVIVRTDFGMIEKCEKVTTDLVVSLAQEFALAVRRRQRHHCIKIALQTLAVLAACAVGQMMSSSGQHKSPLQQRLYARGEYGVGSLDGKLARAQLVRQADLPVLSMSLLCTIEIGDPNLWRVSIQHFADDPRASAVADDMDHHLGVLQHPAPAVAAVNADTGFIGTDDAGAPQACRDRADFGIKTRRGALKRSVLRSLVDQLAAAELPKGFGRG
jgi:hypothetical protein